jgi:hypothetical protein
MDSNKEVCEGMRGANRCGRAPEFLIQTDDSPVSTAVALYSCVECVGRIIVEQDLDDVTVERVYN